MHGPCLETGMEVCLQNKMDIRVVCGQEQEGGPVLNSLPATGHILEWLSPVLTAWLDQCPHWLLQLSTPMPAELHLKPTFPGRKEGPELECALAGKAPEKAV